MPFTFTFTNWLVRVENGKMTNRDDSYPQQWFGPRKPVADDWRADDAAVRQELERRSDSDLEAIDAPRFMFLRYTDDQGFRARVTQRQRIARELLAERAKDGADDHPHDAAIDQLDFPADGHAFGGPSTCISHVGEVGFAAQDDDGLLAKLSNWYFNRLRKMCL